MLPRYFRPNTSSSQGFRLSGTASRPSSSHQAQPPSSSVYAERRAQHHAHFSSSTAMIPASVAAPTHSLLGQRGPLVLPSRNRAALGRSQQLSHNPVGPMPSHTSGNAVSSRQSSLWDVSTPARRADNRRAPHHSNSRYTGLRARPERVQQTPQQGQTRLGNTFADSAASSSHAARLFSPGSSFSGRPNNTTASTRAWASSQKSRNSLRKVAVEHKMQQQVQEGEPRTGSRAESERVGDNDTDAQQLGDVGSNDSSIRETDSELIAELFDDAIAENAESPKVGPPRSNADTKKDPSTPSPQQNGGKEDKVLPDETSEENDGASAPVRIHRCCSDVVKHGDDEVSFAFVAELTIATSAFPAQSCIAVQQFTMAWTCCDAV